MVYSASSFIRLAGHRSVVLLHICLILALTSLRRKRAMTGIDKSTKKECQRREGIRSERNEKEVREKVKALAGIRRA